MDLLIGAFAGPGTIFAIDRTTGQSSTVFSNGPFFDNCGVAYDPDTQKVWLVSWSREVISYDPLNNWARTDYPHSDDAHDALAGAAVSGFTIFPDNFQVFRGVLEGGGLTELTRSDDLYMVIRNGVTALRTESPITLIVEGHAPNLVNSLSVQVENHVSITGLTQRIDAFNFTAGSYTNVDTRSATTTDSVATAALTGVGDYIDANRLVRMRVRVRADGPVFTNTWRSFVDQTIWTGA